MTILSMACARDFPSVCWSISGIGCGPGCASKSKGCCSDSGWADDIGAGVTSEIGWGMGGLSMVPAHRELLVVCG